MPTMWIDLPTSVQSRVASALRRTADTIADDLADSSPAALVEACLDADHLETYGNTDRATLAAFRALPSAQQDLFATRTLFPGRRI